MLFQWRLWRRIENFDGTAILGGLIKWFHLQQKKPGQQDQALFFLVPPGGIEPPLPKEQDFESSASTNSATEA
jgi:hypothetical protein